MTALWLRTDLIEADDSCDPHRTELVDAWVIGRIRVGNDSLWARVVRPIRESLGE
jgi:hypothetical protein